MTVIRKELPTGSMLMLDHGRYRSPVGSSGKWLCESYSRSIDDFDNETLSATFTEVFGE